MEVLRENRPGAHPETDTQTHALSFPASKPLSSHTTTTLAKYP